MAETERERIVRELRHTSQHLGAAGRFTVRFPEQRSAAELEARAQLINTLATMLAGGTADNHGIAEVLLFIADMLEE